jgi:hypothetical protein
MYDPKIGKWISADPIGFKGEDANLYRYVGNSPTRNIDPRGLTLSASVTFYSSAMEKELPIQWTFMILGGEVNGSYVYAIKALAKRYVQYEVGGRTYRERWNEMMGEAMKDRGRPPYYGGTDWAYPNFALLLNGSDDKNPYGGSYEIEGRDTGEVDEFGIPVDNTTYYPDDDYAVLSGELFDADGESLDKDSTETWQPSGGDTGLDVVDHGAKSDFIKLKAKCPPKTLEVDVTYADDNTSYGYVIVTFGGDGTREVELVNGSPSPGEE